MRLTEFARTKLQGVSVKQLWMYHRAPYHSCNASSSESHPRRQRTKVSRAGACSGL